MIINIQSKPASKWRVFGIVRKYQKEVISFGGYILASDSTGATQSVIDQLEAMLGKKFEEFHKVTIAVKGAA